MIEYNMVDNLSRFWLRGKNRRLKDMDELSIKKVYL